MSNKVKIFAGILLLIGIILILLVVLGVFKVKEYTITFNSMGGNEIASQKVEENKTVSKPTNPIREGYEFAYWALNDVEYDFSTKVTKDLTLVAKWEELVKTVEVSFMINGDIKTQQVASLAEIDFASLGFEEKEGYEIKWYVNDEELDPTMELTEGMTIEGKYIKTTTYTVKFNSDGGTKVNNQVVKANETATEPSGVTKYGYILNGWYLNNKKYDFSTPVTKGITLVAKWDEDPDVKRYVVKFDTDGGNKISDKKVLENQTVSAPTNPTKKGYAFEGWYLNDKKYDFKTKVTADITLVAKWRELAKYTVTFDSDNGSADIIKTVTEGETVSAPSNPSKSGYTFKEWQLNGVKYDFKTKVTKNITLKAVYTQNPVVADEYVVTATRVDEFSPDSTLSVTKNGSKISVQRIKTTSGAVLCEGNKMVVSNSEISGKSTVIVVLNSGQEVSATLRRN